MLDQPEQGSLFDPERWGLPMELVDDIANRLRRTWGRFQDCFKTKTGDTSEYAWVYLRGILTMDRGRNFANIARRVIDPEDDGQNLQQFMSDSPWSGERVLQQIQGEMCQRPELAGGVLTLDECGDEKAGNQSAGAGRQYLGRFGKVDMGQVAVSLGYYKEGTWLMVDAELYLPENWFDEEHASLRQRWHIPPSRTFATKPELGLVLIRRAKAQGVPFEVITADELYGRSSYFRAALAAEGLKYVLDVPAKTLVYLTKPVVGVPHPPRARLVGLFHAPKS